jgi:hypothetical protein
VFCYTWRIAKTWRARVCGDFVCKAFAGLTSWRPPDLQKNKIYCGGFSHRIPFFLPKAVSWIPVKRSNSRGPLSIRRVTIIESRKGLGEGPVTCRWSPPDPSSCARTPCLKISGASPFNHLSLETFFQACYF